MNIEELRTFCLSLKGTEEKLPFDDRTLVFTVKGKMFCLTDIEDYESINLKCDPEEAVLLRERYEDVIPGYHMNKNHWNTVKTNGNIPDNLLKEWIRKSYDLVVSGLPKKLQKELKEDFI
jgi:predicted DNA-binding protein (MmcQ/YjbR family)